MNIIFAGTPEFAAVALNRLLNDGRHSVCAVLTQPDRPAGRGKKLTQSPVKQLALAAGKVVLQPASLKTPDVFASLNEFRADVMVVAAYGLILPQTILDLPRFGCINIHASLLPRWRGAAPIQRAIMAGDSESGITIMQMEAGLDTGPILIMQSLPIGERTTAGELHDKLAELGGQLNLAALDRISAGAATPVSQPTTGVTYAAKIEKSEVWLDWHLPAVELDRKIRAFNPWPIARTLFGEVPLHVWRATPLAAHSDAVAGTVVDVTADGITVSTGDGTLRLDEVQLPGRRPLGVREFLNSTQLPTGTIFVFSPEGRQ